MANDDDAESQLLWSNDDYATPPLDLDTFLRDLYAHHTNGGLVGMAAVEVVNWLLACYTLVVCGMVVWGTDWVGLYGGACRTDCTFATFASTRPFRGGSAFATLYAVGSVGVLLWTAARSLSTAPRWLKTRTFWRATLQPRLPELHTWSDVVGVLVARHATDTRLFVNVERVTPLDVAARVLRRENYVVALEEGGVLGPVVLDDVVLWHLWGVLIGPMFGSGECGWELQLTVDGFRRRCILFAALNVAALPLTLVAYTGYCGLKAAERCAKTSGTERALRAWTPSARWRMREFNEYPVAAAVRMARAAAAADRLLRLYPSPRWVGSWLGLVAFVAGSVAGCVTIAALRDDNVWNHVHVADRNMLWWLACCTVVVTAVRAGMPTKVRYSQQAVASAIDALRQELRYATFLDGGHDEVFRRVASAMPFVAVSWARSIRSLVAVPWVLRRWHADAAAIVAFVRDGTERSVAAGDVWSDSLLQPMSTVRPSESKAARSALSFHEAYTVSGWR